MLCYLDDVLDTADANELGRKIEESEYASDVVHRVRSCMRQVRLGAPKPMGKGMGSDANTVADYLDNVMSADQVPDFERLCLSSDAHLAEVAACHQVLTLVLGEPAEVPVEMRQRIYGIGSATAQPPPASPPVEAATANGKDVEAPPVQDAPVQDAGVPDGASQTDASRKRERPQVPDYLKAGRQRAWWPIMVTVVLVMLLVGAAVVTLWPPGDAAVSSSAGNGGEEHAASSSIPDANDRDAAPGDSSTSGNDQPSTSDDQSAAVDGDAKGDSSTPDDKIDFADDLTVPDKTGDDVGSGVVPSETPGGTGDEKPVEGAGTATDGDNPKPTDKPKDSSPADSSPADSSPVGGETKPDEVARIDPPLKPLDPPETPTGEKVGHFTSIDQLLVRHDEKSKQWSRLPSREPLTVGNPLRVLPTYRPQVMLDNGIQIIFPGHTAVEVLEPLDEGTPLLEVHYGRAIVATVGKPGAKIAFQLGARRCVATLLNADSELALEVKQIRPQAGDDPEKSTSVQVLVLYVTGGEIEWNVGEEEALTLAAGRRVVRAAGADVAETVVSAVIANVERAVGHEGEPPAWLKSNDVSDIDRRASTTLEPMLPEERSVSLSLAEAAEDHRVEVRSLAARSLAALDQFDRMVELFNDADLKSYWSQHFDALQHALARDTQTAGAVRQSFQRQRADGASDLYRMLWGYSPKDLEDGADQELFDYLSHESLDFRVLAIENLRRITGRTLFYNAHVSEARRRAAVQKWKEKLDKDEIRFETPSG